MSRTWVALWITSLVAVVALVGCGPKKGPTTSDEVQMDTKPAPPTETVSAPAAPPVTEDVQESPWWENKSLVELNSEAERRGFQPNVYFEFDQSDLTDDARQKLQANARFLQENPNLGFTIEGHCDERGTNDYNLALGDRRANTAGDYLVGLGISHSRYRTISYGEERPVCTESTEACWARNRRAYFVLSFAS
jgi:peptidoglycan-associated lipoprotein